MTVDSKTKKRSAQEVTGAQSCGHAQEKRVEKTSPARVGSWKKRERWGGRRYHETMQARMSGETQLGGGKRKLWKPANSTGKESHKKKPAVPNTGKKAAKQRRTFPGGGCANAKGGGREKAKNPLFTPGSGDGGGTQGR